MRDALVGVQRGEVAGPAAQQQHGVALADAALEQEADVSAHAGQVQFQVAVVKQRRHRNQNAGQPGFRLLPVHGRGSPVPRARSLAVAGAAGS
jgi:hypothetical protein